jgi:drug/metabolite transporter (DMT)-like permease
MLWSTGLYAVFGAATLPWVWVTPTLTQLPVLMLMGCIATAGMFFFVRAYKYAEAASLAPFDYMAMGWAALFGFVFWGEIPQATAFVGIGVIAVSGLYIVHREAMRRRAVAAKVSTPDTANRARG